MATTMAIGKIGIGNTSTLATFKKCFGFTKMDAGAIRGIKKLAFGANRPRMLRGTRVCR
jgi:hypothetical protein